MLYILRDVAKQCDDVQRHSTYEQLLANDVSYSFVAVRKKHTYSDACGEGSNALLTLAIARMFMYCTRAQLHECNLT